MHKVFLFGSRSLGTIPDVIQNHIVEIIKQTNGEVEFIVGDANGVDAAFHQVLSGVGGRGKTKVYSVGDARNNKFDLDNRRFDIIYSEDAKTVHIVDGATNQVIDEAYNVDRLQDYLRSSKLYESKDKQMCRDCTFAICYWDGTSKGTLRNIDRLKAQGKYVYVYTANLG